MRKTTVYITIGIVLILLYFLTRKTRSEMINTPTVVRPSSNDLASNFQELKKNFGQDFARQIERLFRLETAHFTSGQFKEGNSPGMVANKTTYPYGWSSLDEFARANSIDGRKFGIGRTFVVRGKNYRYVTFPDFKTSLKFVAWFIRNKRGGIPEKWNSLNDAKAAEYKAKLNQIIPRFT